MKHNVKDWIEVILFCIGGLAIILWEVFNPWGWMIFWLWGVIPIPLVLFGFFFLGAGILMFFLDLWRWIEDKATDKEAEELFEKEKPK